MSDATAKVIGLPGLTDKFRQLAQGVGGDALAKAATAGALVIQSAAKEKAPKRTRTLSRSIHTEVTEQRDDYAEVAIGTDVIYAAIQEFGGTITPKNAKYLAIPLTEEAKRHAGGPRTFGGDLSPRMSGNGGVLVDSNGVAQYALTKSVTIPAKPYLRPALDENIDKATEDIGRALTKILEGIANA